MSEWQRYDFAEVIDFREGPGIMAVDFRTDGVPLVRLAGLDPDGSILRKCNYLDPAKVESKWSHFRLAHGDVLLSTSASLGRVRVVPEEGVGAVPYTGIIRMRPKDDRLAAEFIPWLLRGSDFAEQVEMAGVGSVMAHFGPSHLRRMSLLLPPVDEQRQIAAVLSAFDDLIDTNRGLAQTSCTLVSAGFARRFSQKELALPLGEVADVVDCLHSKKPERIAEGSNVLVQLNNIRDNGLYDARPRYLIDEADFAMWSKKFLTRPWDCVITNVGRIGAVSRIPAGVSAAIGRNMTGIRPVNPAQDGAFIIAALLSDGVREEIEARTDSGTVMNALNVRSIPHLRLPYATERERKQFQKWAGPLLTAADACEAEASRLIDTRDELLPLLMSGRVRVDDALAAA